MKKLKRSSKDVLISGVAAGIAEHLNVDSTLIRILWVLLIFMFVGFGVLLYIVMWIIVPKDEDNTKKNKKQKNKKTKNKITEPKSENSENLVSSENTTKTKNQNKY